MIIRPILLFVVYINLCTPPCVYTQTNNEYTLNILHLNDFHARFEETSIYSGRCSEKDAQANKCYGGFARIHSKVEEIRRGRENVVFLAAGDYYQGTVWYTIHKWRAMARFLNLIGQDVMSVGNHEFDDGLGGLVPFLDNVTFPVLAANIDDSLEPSIRGKILPSVVLERGGRKIGIVGYLTTETATIANPGKVKILDEVEGVRRESRRLRESGVDIIIALGHAGFRKDLDIAQNVEDVDIVVGGHTNTFLFTGKDPSTESSMGEYPTVVPQSSGRKVLVVQAYAFGKYLGDLQVTFDQKGEIVRWDGNPILLDNTVPQDPNILRELVPWRLGVDDVIAETIGRTFVFLDGNRMSCRMKECNLGNLEADAIVHQNAKYPDDMEWAQTGLAVINGGGIRSSIDERTANGSISLADILSVAPFQNTIDIVELRGRHIREMFEHSVGNYDPVGLDPPGGFLQVSGFHVVYDITKPVGSRVVSLAARCSACRIPDFREIEKERVYKVAMPSFLANGGDGYSMIKDNKINHHLTGLLDTDILSQYISMFSPIYQGIENRILFLHSSAPCSALQDPPLPSTSSNSSMTLSSNQTSTTSSTSISNNTKLEISSGINGNKSVGQDNSLQVGTRTLSKGSSSSEPSLSAQRPSQASSTIDNFLQVGTRPLSKGSSGSEPSPSAQRPSQASSTIDNSLQVGTRPLSKGSSVAEPSPSSQRPSQASSTINEIGRTDLKRTEHSKGKNENLQGNHERHQSSRRFQDAFVMITDGRAVLRKLRIGESVLSGGRKLEFGSSAPEAPRKIVFDKPLFISPKKRARKNRHFNNERIESDVPLRISSL